MPGPCFLSSINLFLKEEGELPGTYLTKIIDAYRLTLYT
jgi:hypothetical protein